MKPTAIAPQGAVVGDSGPPAQGAEPGVFAALLTQTTARTAVAEGSQKDGPQQCAGQDTAQQAPGDEQPAADVPIELVAAIAGQAPVVAAAPAVPDPAAEAAPVAEAPAQDPSPHAWAHLADVAAQLADAGHAALPATSAPARAQAFAVAQALATPVALAPALADAAPAPVVAGAPVEPIVAPSPVVPAGQPAPALAIPQGAGPVPLPADLVSQPAPGEEAPVVDVAGLLPGAEPQRAGDGSEGPVTPPAATLAAAETLPDAAGAAPAVPPATGDPQEPAPAPAPAAATATTQGQAGGTPQDGDRRDAPQHRPEPVPGPSHPNEHHAGRHHGLTIADPAPAAQASAPADPAAAAPAPAQAAQPAAQPPAQPAQPQAPAATPPAATPAAHAQHAAQQAAAKLPVTVTLTPAGMGAAVERIHDLVKVAGLRDGHARATLQLKPAELGTVNVHLRTTSEGLIATIRAHDAVALAALKQAGSELQQSLQDRGVTLARLDLQLSSGGDSAARERRESARAFTGDRNGRRSRDDRHETPDGELELHVTEVAAPSTPVLADGSLVDVRA